MNRTIERTPDMESNEYLLNLKRKIDKLKIEQKLKRIQIINQLNIHELTYTRALNIERKLEQIKNESITYSRLERLVNEFKNRNGNYPKNDYTYLDVIKKFGENPKCYYTGEPITLKGPGYSLDHLIAVGCGGSNESENMELCKDIVNVMKNAIEQKLFIETCKRIGKNFSN